MSRSVVYFAICLLIQAFTLSQLGPAPGCQYATFWVDCYYINEENAYIVQEYLTLASQLFHHYSLAFYYSNITTLPTDLLQGYVLDEILFQENEDVFNIPALLSNANTNLLGLSFSNEHISSLSKEELDLPFSENLQHFYFIDCPIQDIEEGAFLNYSSLQELWLQGNKLPILKEATLNGAAALKSLILYNGTLNGIEVGVFQDIQTLQELELDYNQLAVLDQGSFNGLPLTTRIFLYDNPFNCTCELQWLKTWLIDSYQLETSGATCSYPIVAPFSEVDFCTEDGTSIKLYETLN